MPPNAGITRPLAPLGEPFAIRDVEEDPDGTTWTVTLESALS